MRTYLSNLILLAAGSLIAFHSVAQAQELQAPTQRNYQVLHCPTIPAKYDDLITKLNTLKTNIKDEANCEPVDLQLKSFEDLIGTDREKFLTIIKENTDKNLEVDDADFVKNYVENVTKKSLSLTQLFKDSQQCFAEDNKDNSFDLISTLINEGTSLINHVAGPYGAPIALSGTILSGLFQGVDSILKSRRSYDFDTPEQRQSYAKNLCTYYNYRKELNILLQPSRRNKRINDLTTLRQALDVKLQAIRTQCAECNQLAIDFTNPNGGSRSQLKSRAKQIDDIYQEKVGNFTLHSLNTMKWLSQEENTLKDVAIDTTRGHVGADILMDLKLDLDHFIFEREADDFIHFHIDKSADAYVRFSHFVTTYIYTLNRRTNPHYQERPPLLYTVPSPQLLGQAIDDLDKEIRQSQKFTESDRAIARSAYNKALDLYQSAQITHSITQNYCQFFMRASLYLYVKDECESDLAQSVTQNIASVKIASANTGPVQQTEDERVTAQNWSESMSHAVERLRRVPLSLRRR